MIIDEGEFLQHFGVKGMKWGVRRATGRGAKKKAPRRSADAKKKDTILERRARGGTRVLSNNDIQIAVRRIELERRIDTLAPPRNTGERVRRVISGLLTDGRTVNDAISFANSPAGRAVQVGIGTRSLGPRAAAAAAARRAVPQVPLTMQQRQAVAEARGN